MADVQKQFITFHDSICLRPYGENAILREKRDAVLCELKSGLKALFEAKGEKPPAYSTFNQGSYAMGTGIKPLNDDYDIDVGVMFEVSPDQYPDPVTVKRWVYDAVCGHTQSVEMRRPCVTVFYQCNDEPLYHVDLAIYSDPALNGDALTYLARGKLNSSSDYRLWEEAAPRELMETLGNRFSGDDRDQYRRCIRYLKRWRQERFTCTGHASPSGIAITVAAYHWFMVQKTLVDRVAAKYKYDDLKALGSFVQDLIARFVFVYHDGEWVERLQVNLPARPWNDLLSQMTNMQMSAFKDRLVALDAVLQGAVNEVDPVVACTSLQAEFGADLPIPEASQTAQPKGPALITSSSAA
jgi:hypothetical protein